MRGIAPTTPENTQPISMANAKKDAYAKLRAQRRKVDAEADKFLNEASAKIEEIIVIASNLKPRQS